MKEVDSLWIVRLFHRFTIWLAHYRVTFLSGLISGLLAHVFAFTNKFVNHDEVAFLFSKGATSSSGRWFLDALDIFLPNFSMPWIYGILTIVLISLAVCLMSDLFGIRSRVLQALLGSCVLVFPSLTGTFSYMFTSSAYGVAFLLAVLGVWMICKVRFWVIAGLISTILSLGIYQPYIAISATLLVLVLIQDLLQGQQALPIFKRGLFYLGFLVLSLGLYMLITELILKLTHTQLSSYADDRVIFQLSLIPQRALMAYREFFNIFTQGAFGLTSSTESLHCLLAVVCVGLLVCWLWTGEHRPSSVALLLILIALLPLSINCMFLFADESTIHTLVLYSFIGFYLFAVVLLQEVFPKNKISVVVAKLLKNIGICLMSLVIIGNIFLANQAYLHLHLRYENAFSFYSNVLSAIQQSPEFQEGYKIAILGWRSPEAYASQFDDVMEIVGIKGLFLGDYSVPQFIEYYLGVSLPFADQARVEQLYQTEQFRQMPVYPYAGSIQCIDDCLVVKLSE